MLKSAAIILFGAIHALSLYGYGRYFQKLDGRARSMPWSMCVVVGLGCWIFLGGILNLLHLAHTWYLNAIVVVGLGLAASVLLRAAPETATARETLWPQLAAATPSLLIVVAAGLFVGATLVPSAAFNVADDFHKYMVYPLRMLQSGSLAGSPLSSLGTTMLGGQSFLQGFVLGHFPPAYVNGFDLFFCFVLCMLLLVDFGAKLRISPAIVLCSVLSVVFINPQYVNVSSVYSTSAFALALLLFAVIRTGAVEHDRRSDSFTGIVVALFYSALIILKTTLWLFIAIHFVFLLAAFGAATRDARRTMRIAMSVMLATAFFLSPWVLLYLPQYLAAAQSALAPAALLPTLAMIYGEPIPAPSPRPYVVDIFSTKTLFHGGTFAAYTFTVCLALYYGGLSRIGAKARDAAQRAGGAVFAGASAAVFAAYPVYIYFAGSHLPGAGPESWLRFFCPILIGTVPALLLLAAAADAKDSATNPVRRWLTTAQLLLPALVMLWAFSPSANDRLRQASRSGSVLAYPALAQSQDYLSRNDLVLHGQARKAIERLQEMIPPQERFVAWISTPLNLDYARNRIIDVDSTGLASVGATLPGARDYDEIQRYFQNLNVRYILWEYGPDAEQAADLLKYATATSAHDRRIGINSLCFRKMLETASAYKRGANVVRDDGSTMLLRLGD